MGIYGIFLIMGIALRTRNSGNYGIFLIMGITLKDPKLWEFMVHSLF